MGGRTCSVCGKEIGVFQKGLECRECHSRMHKDCAVERRTGYHCPNCGAMIERK